MIDDAIQERLYATDPHNYVRIIQNRSESSDSTNRERHRRASGLLHRWIDDGTIQRDAAPSVYIYRQHYTHNEADYHRTGAIVQVKLTDFDRGIVLPHEQTFDAPKADRYEHIDILQMHTEQIFGILNDNGDFFSACNRCIQQQDPTGEAIDSDGVTHTLYAVSDPEQIDTLVHAASDCTILIADGHHRYETALKYYRLKADDTYGYVMMTLVSKTDPGLVIRPFHRMLKKEGISIPASFVSALESSFSCENLGPAGMSTIDSFLNGNGEWDMLYMDKQSGTLYGLRVNEEGMRYLNDHRIWHSDAWLNLNVSKINLLCLEGILNISLDGEVLHDILDFVNNASVAFDAVVQTDDYYGCFFIRPTDIGTINTIVSGNERMPQKSTNFYPKVYSGLVFSSVGG
jgi:uncharacterized protein (DUF1015 family)